MQVTVTHSVCNPTQYAHCDFPIVCHANTHTALAYTACIMQVTVTHSVCNPTQYAHCDFPIVYHVNTHTHTRTHTHTHTHTHTYTALAYTARLMQAHTVCVTLHCLRTVV